MSIGTCPPAKAKNLVAGWYIFLRQCGAFAEEILCHLLYKELLCLRRPGLETVFIEQHFLVLEPLAPGLLRNVVINLVTEVAIEGGSSRPSISCL